MYSVGLLDLGTLGTVLQHIYTHAALIDAVHIVLFSKILEFVKLNYFPPVMIGPIC